MMFLKRKCIFILDQVGGLSATDDFPSPSMMPATPVRSVYPAEAIHVLCILFIQ